MEEEIVKKRILKDIALFYDSLRTVKNIDKDKKLEYIIKLSEMYAKDSQSYLEKGDMCTAFSCISYAHGLLDATKEFVGVDIGTL
ncbi:MAG: DUF357 domain-containing protein [Candidatus Micrarchaeia archaeon]